VPIKTDKTAVSDSIKIDETKEDQKEEVADPKSETADPEQNASGDANQPNEEEKKKR